MAQAPRVFEFHARPCWSTSRRGSWRFGAGGSCGARRRASHRFIAASVGVRELGRVVASCVHVDGPPRRGRQTRDDFDTAVRDTAVRDTAEDVENAGSNAGGFPVASAYVPSVRSGVCVDLDDAREMYRRLPDLLEKVRETVVRKIPRVLRGRGVEDNLSVVYLPKTGFMLRCVGRAPAGHRGRARRVRVRL